MELYATECFTALLDIYSLPESSLDSKYKKLRQLVERICRELMQNESLQMTDLAARISFVSVKFGLDRKEQNQLHTFRLTSNEILNGRKIPTEEEFLRDVRTLAFVIKKIFQKDIPQELYAVIPKKSWNSFSYERKEEKRIKRMRVCFHEVDENYLYVEPVDFLSDTLLKVRYNISQVNEVFTPVIKDLWKFAQLNLLDVSVEEDIYIPGFIVLEPDYLLDISSLAECFKEYGVHPDNYIFNKLIPISNSRPLLIGNIANLFLDEWIHSSEEVDYISCMKKAFKTYSIEIAACQDLQDKEKERAFFKDCRLHFEHIRKVVKYTMQESGYRLDKTDAVLEPSYICEALGIQGRLDYMQRDMSGFIEMKSGKADEYSLQNKIEPKENNRVQMLLYMAVLEYNMGINHREQHPYLLYTRYPLLYPARASWNLVKRAIQIRNQIVAEEYRIQYHNEQEYTRGKLLQITPDSLNQKRLSGRFWELYLRPSLQALNHSFSSLSSLEQAYYISLYNFVTKEQYLSKSGDVLYEGKSGASSLWLSTFAEKCESGEILYNLRILENRSFDSDHASIILSLPEYDDEFLPNFRSGDVIMLYERNKETDNVTNKMVMKGSIEEIFTDRVKVRLRSKQKNRAILPESSLYAIEHDVMDISYRSMFQSLYLFSKANKDRRDLLLSQREPDFDIKLQEKINSTVDDFERVALKAEAAKDYFLLVGPPGTGKTSRALKRMVEKSYKDSDKQILLLAYTNRAVDEICKSVLSIDPEISFIRIGSELSCEEKYRKYLLQNVLAECSSRVEVTTIISDCRIVIGTIASVAAKPELFKLKTFDMAIVDEATQILEPQLIGILCNRNEKGQNAIGKFILIGDHKQLPAVVLQNREQSAVHHSELNKTGFVNLQDSLFERLYRKHRTHSDSMVIDMLSKQGRMHPEIADFPNHTFYDGKLQIVGLAHQLETPFLSFSSNLTEEDKELTKRVVFFASTPCKRGNSGKINVCESEMVADLVARLYKYYKNEFHPDKTLGIITPYRNQIAMIRKAIGKLNIPVLKEITIDTVERYQGSERDVIIYSFCLNYPWQLRQLINTIEEDGKIIDRKLNVALTRARKQLFLIGVPDILRGDETYSRLLSGIYNN